MPNAGAAFWQAFHATNNARIARQNAQAQAEARLEKEFWTTAPKLWGYTQTSQVGPEGKPLNKQMAIGAIARKYGAIFEKYQIDPNNVGHFLDYISGNPRLTQNLQIGVASGQISPSAAFTQLAQAGVDPQALNQALSNLGQTYGLRLDEQRGVLNSLNIRGAQLSNQRAEVGLARDIYARDVVDPQTTELRALQIARADVGHLRDIVGLHRDQLGRDIDDPQQRELRNQQIRQNELRIQELETDLYNQNIPQNVVEGLATDYGVNWLEATPEQRMNVMDKIGRTTLFGELPQPVRTELFNMGVRPNELTPNLLDAANRIVSIQKRQSLIDDARAQIAGREAGELDRRLTSTDEGVVRDWAAQFRSDSGRAPTYRDLSDAGITIPNATVASDIVRRRTGVHDAINITTRLIDTINNTGEGFRGAPAFTARFLSNLRASTEGFINIAEQTVPGSRAQVESIAGELVNSPSVINSLTEKSEAARVLTIQLAYALARSEGLEGRAITATILKDNFIPQAAGIVNDPAVASGRLTDVLNGAISRFNDYQNSILGPAIPPVAPISKPNTPIGFSPLQATPPTGVPQTDITETQRNEQLLLDYRKNNPELFIAP